MKLRRTFYFPEGQYVVEKGIWIGSGETLMFGRAGWRGRMDKLLFHIHWYRDGRSIIDVEER